MQSNFPIKLIAIYMTIVLFSTKISETPESYPSSIVAIAASISDLQQTASDMIVAALNPSTARKPTAVKTKQNFALGSAGAFVVSSSSNLLNPKSILDKQVDNYMFWECDEAVHHSHFVVFLSEDTYIESFDLIFSESFSTYIKDFSVSTSLRQNSSSWEQIGFFRAEKGMARQSFSVKEPRLGRYLRVDIHSVHRSSNFYCTLTQLTVYGRTYLEITTQKSREKIEQEFKNIRQRFEELKKENVEILDAYPLLNSYSPGNLEYNVRRMKQLSAGEGPVPDRLAGACTVRDYFHSFLALTCHSTETIADSEGPIEPYIEMLSLKIKKVESENIQMRRHLKNMTAFIMHKEIGKYRMLKAKEDTTFLDEESLNYDHLEDSDFLKRSETARRNKRRQREQKRIRYLEQKVRLLEEAMSKEHSNESRYFFWFALCWAGFQAVSLLRYAFAWLYQHKNLSSATSFAAHSPFRPVTRRLNKMFQSFIMEKGSSKTKAEED